MAYRTRRVEVLRKRVSDTAALTDLRVGRGSCTLLALRGGLLSQAGMLVGGRLALGCMVLLPRLLVGQLALW